MKPKYFPLILESALVSALLYLPIFFTVSRFAQSPDGFELVETAVRGGVLHPSGMPLQAWLDRWTVWLFSSSPESVLSYSSFFVSLLAAFTICFTLRVLNVSGWAAALATACFAFHPVLWGLSITPEKYALIALAESAFFLAAIFTLKIDAGRRSFWFLTLALIAALAQHSALVILLPAYALLLFYGVRLKKIRPKDLAMTVSTLILGVAAFYISLPLLRTDSAWPDWGRIESLTEIWRHVSRADYSYLKLHQNTDAHLRVTSGLKPFFMQVFGWSWIGPMAILGLWAARREKILWCLVLTMIGGLDVLDLAQMPLLNLGVVNGYQERYQCLLLPVLCLLWGLGWLGLEKRLKGEIKPLVLAVLTISMGYYGWQGWALNSKMNSSLIDGYRTEVGRELPPEAIFYSASDLVGFSGVPTERGLRFPVKNLFGLEWYRDRTIPDLEPRLKEVMAKLSNENKNLSGLVKQAIADGYTIAATEATRFLDDDEIMKHAEQIGLIWLFSANTHELYSDRILHNTLKMCEGLEQVTEELPINGIYFPREALSAYRFAFMGAADMLEARKWIEAATRAREVAGVLSPGVKPKRWHERCHEYTQALFLALRRTR